MNARYDLFKIRIAVDIIDVRDKRKLIKQTDVIISME